jgi:hypothetical protein
MERFGLVTHMVAPEAVGPTVDRMTTTLEGYPLHALQDMTRLLRAVGDVPTAVGLDLEWQEFRRHFVGRGEPGSVTIRP